MSLDPRNVGTIVGGLTTDPELINENILKLRVAVDYAGNDRVQTDNKSGYFNVTYFLNNDTPNTKFVANQVREGKMKKGSQVHILYRLVQDRWEQDGQNRQAVTLVAESLTYAGSAPRTETATSTASSTEAANVPDEF